VLTQIKALKQPLTDMAYLTTAPPTDNHFCVSTSSPTCQSPITFSGKGTLLFTEDISALYEALASKLPPIFSSFSYIKSTVYLFKPKQHLTAAMLIPPVQLSHHLHFL
jgi:hypothetical protein